MQGGPVGASLHILAYGGIAVYCFILPGYALSIALSPRKTLSWLGQIAISSALSVALYPLLFLWTSTVGVSIWPVIVWAPGGIGLIAIIWSRRSSVRSTPFVLGANREHAYTIALLILIAGLLLSRFLPVRNMIAPAWGDSVHHTMIAQLVQENGALFQSWAPYAPIESFSYHFGFHVNMAVWASATSQSMQQAVISGGQIFNVLAVLAIYPIAVRLGGSRMAGFGAILVAGLVSQQPGMYVNWGRYTQLAAQVMLPVWLWTLDVWWTEPKRPPRRMLILTVLLATGLALTHYRVAIVALCAAVAWGVWSLWLMRSHWQEWLTRTLWLAGAGVVSLALVVPWILTIRAGRLTNITGALAQRDTDHPAVRGDLTVWRTINTYYAPYLWAASLGALLLALWRRRRMAVPLLIWVALTFLAANPFLARLAGTGIVTNFLLALGLYIPLSLLTGWLLAQLWMWANVYAIRDVAVGKYALVIALVLLATVGFRRQATIVDPFYQMMTDNDLAAMSWIEKNVPEDNGFLVNAFPAYNDSLVVGSDGGWWLPYYTRRATNVPPILYSVEALSPQVDRDDLLQLVFDIRESQGHPDALRSIMCSYGYSHVYLGDRQGSVGFGETQLLKPEWLEHNRDYDLLYESGNAQVWAFDLDVCSAPR